MRNTAIFLGAGASAAEGAPMQNALFKIYFKNAGEKDKRTEIYKGLKRFFETVFGMNLNDRIDWDDQTNQIVFPSFEEALGVLDLAELRRESLRSFDSTTLVSNSNQIRLTRLYLVLAMSKAIADELKRKSAAMRPHRKLVNNLEQLGLLERTVFISTNYDLLIDNAITNDDPNSSRLNYGVEFINPGGTFGGQNVAPDAVPLFKIHGSLNWLYCPTCNNLNGYNSKVVVELIQNAGSVESYDKYAERTKCEFCRSVLTPVIVPPTFYKDMSNVFLSAIWNKTENALRAVDHVIFCGYSFPEADMHIKYLLKRVQTNRVDYRSVRFTLINHHLVPPKDDEQADEEKKRYFRFLGANVTDTRESFEAFAENPKRFYEVA